MTTVLETIRSTPLSYATFLSFFFSFFSIFCFSCKGLGTLSRMYSPINASDLTRRLRAFLAADEFDGLLMGSWRVTRS